MVELQEFFSSSESKEEFESKLIEAGFKRATKFSNGFFRTKNILINVQKNNYKGKGIVEAPHDYQFVLELYKDLNEFDKESPLFKFFKSLDEPCAHGICG